MLELARDTDRPAVNAMARQVHAMHVAWRPDIYEMVEELYPEGLPECTCGVEGIAQQYLFYYERYCVR